MTAPRNPFESMARCGAKTRNGKPCRRIGNMQNGRCKLHGGGAGAPLGQQNGAWRHGNQTKEAKAKRQSIRTLLREATKLLRDRQ
jgi:hypothetical protein